MSCKCKNIIENFQGGTIPLNTTFLQNVDCVGNILSGGTNLLDIFSTTTSSGSTGGGGTFTGNTSATCINELWVSNIFGCSPVTIGTDMAVTGNISQTGETSTFSNGYYTEISTGFANTGQLTFNANHDGGVATNTYTPTYAGDINAGMTVVKMPTGGHGGLDFYVKKHGTTSGSQDLSTFTKILFIKT